LFPGGLTNLPGAGTFYCELASEEQGWAE
jgi:hypothetical protein